MDVSQQALEEMTQYFWDQKDDKENDFWDLYLTQAEIDTGTKEKSLLAYEMAYADTQQDADEKPRLPLLHNNTTLVILVGESLEPLFQSIWAHNPKRLIPVVNEHYPPTEGSHGPVDGIVHWATVRNLLKKMLKRPSRDGEWQLILDTLPEIKNEKTKNQTPKRSQNIYKSVQDDPDVIFTYLQGQLRDDLLNPNCRVVIDITGAKKTMVAGAFMLAAYSDARICYIDTEQHSENGRPYGFSCRFRTVANPVKKLSLQNWDKLGELYDQYNFSSALNLIPEQKDEKVNETIEPLRHFLCMCHYWEIGQLALAWEEAKQLPDNLKPYIPLAVKELHDCWPQPKSKETTDTLFNETRNVVIYAYDELYRVCRLKSKKKSYRDAFGRAYAVYETLFKARVINLYINKQVQVLPVKKWDKQLKTNIPLHENTAPQLATLEQPWYENGLKACMGMSSEAARKLLRQKSVVEKGEKNRWFQMNWTATSSLQSLGDDELNPGKVLRDKRNEITHTYMPVTEGDVDKAIVLAQSNFANYLLGWVNLPQKISLDGLDNKENYRVPKWKLLRGICNLHFIPVESRDNEGDAR